MKKFPLIVLGTIFSVLSFYSHSFGFNAVKKLQSMKVCRKCNLVGVDLTGASFENTNLSKANLVGANIKKK